MTTAAVQPKTAGVPRCGDEEPETAADAHPNVCDRLAGHSGDHMAALGGATWPLATEDRLDLNSDA